MNATFEIRIKQDTGNTACKKIEVVYMDDRDLIEIRLANSDIMGKSDRKVVIESDEFLALAALIQKVRKP